MALLHIPLEKIDQSHLQRLIDGQAAESREIDYKSQTYGGSDKERAEFLADISSFANAVGGDLIIGMAATSGAPTAFTPFTGDFDAECLRLENMARTGLEPRISNLQLKSISLKNGGCVIVIRVPRSFNPPHRIVFQGKNRFCARSSAGKYDLNVDELRSLFTLAPQLSEKIRQFRAERIAKIVARDLPVTLLDSCCFALHVIPFAAFDIRKPSFMSDVVQHPNYFPPLARTSPTNWYVNFDGLVTLSNADTHQKTQRAYVQIFRSGIVEAVASSITQGDANHTVVAMHIEAMLVRYSRIYVNGLHGCGIMPPIAILASLVGMKGHSIKYGFDTMLHADAPTICDRDQMHFSEVIFDSVPASDQDSATIVRPVLEQLANVAGNASPATFDAAGKYLMKI